MSVSEAKSLEGKFIDESHYHTKITSDADVYWEDNGELKLLFHYRKKAIPGEMLDNAIDVFKKEAHKASSIRGVAGGVVEPSKVSPNVREVVSKNKYKSKVIFKDGTTTSYYVSNKVNSLIAGYFDKSKVTDRHEDILHQRVPCRTTSFTERNTDKWRSFLPLVKLVDKHYSSLEPGTHKAQLKLANKTPKFQIDQTAFSTVTVNYNWRTACHVDGGDFRDGYSVLLVAEKGQWDGACLGYPRFGVMIDMRHGDFLLKDPHQQHCNTQFEPLSDDYMRMSFVFYYRENMQKCATMPVPPVMRSVQKGGGKARSVPAHTGKHAVKGLKLVPAKFPKRNIDLELYIREDTTDIKVIKEVLSANVYEKPKLDFYVQPGDRWLDLGGNIGTFALLVLSRGASVVTCEPEKDNIAILEKNLLHNFADVAGKMWQIVPSAVTPKRGTSIDLYLCKGDYNKYRHTIYHKRGRESVKVKNMSIYTLLKKDKFNAIKIDIEGAEIDILEALKPSDYKGIEKMVFEYSFDIDPSIPRFLAIIKKLRKVFNVVHYTKVKENELEYKHFPAMTMVYCLK